MAREGTGARRTVLISAGVLVVMAAAVIAIVLVLRNETATPGFPKLADNPDTSLTGTVAYWDTKCVHLVSLSGSPGRRVACNAEGDFTPIESVVWLEDGRLQVFKDAYTVYDLRTGTSEVVSADAAVSMAAPTITNADGQTIAATSTGGRVAVTVTDSAGTRTLLDKEAGKLYELGAPQWAADGTNVLVHDSADRILLITTETTPVTRVLATGAAILFGATAEDVLSA